MGMNRNWKSIILVISSFFALSASISAAPGDLDPTFGNGGKRTDWAGFASGVAIQPDGKIVVVGDPNLCCRSDIDFRVARYNPDGSPDTTFGGGTGRVTTDFNGNHDESEDLILQPDGKIIVAGWTILQSNSNLVSLAVARYNPDGSLDTTFGGGSGKVQTALGYFGTGRTDVALQPDGKILAVLGEFDFNDNNYGLLVRYNADGSPDTSFGNGGSVLSQYAMFSVTVQPADGKIVVNENGYYTPFDPPRIARFNTNGSLDTAFGSDGRVTVPAGVEFSSLAIDSAGKIVTAGGSVNGSTFEFTLVRFNGDGSPDSSFDGDGIVTTPSLQWANSIVIQSDSKIVAAGYGQGPGNYDLALARYNSNGSLDNTFGGGDGITTVDFNNSSDFGAAVALDSQGRVVVVGETGPVGGSVSIFAIARFLGDPTPTCANPIDCPDFFVRQHYLDFLNREPDAPGLAHWINEITICSDVANQLPGETQAQCIDRKRVNTSGAFYLSNEFQNSANFLIRVNWGSLGKDRAIGRKCIVGQHNALDAVCRPLYSDYVADMAKLTQGIVVNDQLDPNVINANKRNFVTEFVMRPGFLAEYPNAMTPDAYVDKLAQTTGIALSAQERQDLIAKVQTQGRAAVLFDIVDGTITIAGGQLVFNTRYGQAYYDQEFNPAFVFVEYLGYLRRNPDQAGYDHWLGKLNLYGNFVDAEMVRAFIVSDEYRGRFGSN